MTFEDNGIGVFSSITAIVNLQRNDDIDNDSDLQSGRTIFSNLPIVDFSTIIA